MRGTAAVITFLCLISSAASLSSTTFNLAFFKNNTFPIPISVNNGSNIYLTSSDKANALAKITLTTRGKSITLDKLLSNFDDNGYQLGWPVYSDLTISTKNNENVTTELTGSLFVSTPTQAQDPNFLVYVVRGTQTLDRSGNDNTTIVFLNRYRTNNGTMGFTHTRVTNIVQPRTSRLGFYRGNPDDQYVDMYSARKIFMNPLEVSPTQQVFFDNIDPIQYSLHIWSMRATGGIKLDVSDQYVDTTSIQAGAVTTTGMSNSQLFNYNSSVTFVSNGDNLATSGYVVSTEMFAAQNITIVLNGKNKQSDSFALSGDNFNYETVASWSADNMQIYPTSRFAGIYWIQYFKIDNGPATTSTSPSTSPTPPPTTSTPAPANPSTASTPTVPTSSSVSSTSSFSTSSQPPGLFSTTIQTTTQSAATSFSLISLAVANFMYLRF